MNGSGRVGGFRIRVWAGVGLAAMCLAPGGCRKKPWEPGMPELPPVPRLSETTDAPRLLRNRYEPGDTRRQTLRMSMEIAMPPGRKPARIAATTDADLTARIVEVSPEGNGRVATTIDRMRTEVYADDALAVRADTSDPSSADDPAVSALQAIVGTTMTAVMSPQGTALELDFRENATAVERIAGEAGAAAARGALDALASRFTDWAMVMLPEKPVRAGDTFDGGTTRAALRPGMPGLEMQQAGRILEIASDGSRAVFELKPRVTFSGDGPVRWITAEADGWALLDLAHGFPLDMAMRFRMVAEADGERIVTVMSMRTTTTEAGR